MCETPRRRHQTLVDAFEFRTDSDHGQSTTRQQFQVIRTAGYAFGGAFGADRQFELLRIAVGQRINLFEQRFGIIHL